jgi:protein-S-isoprenylcysteine O-methyltransferase Ste14
VVLTFRRALTPVSPRRQTTRLVCHGPYRYTRNPDYIGQLALYIGLALALNSLWPLIGLPMLLALIHWGVVLREERYLESKFGQEYREYTARVRRWL